MKKIHKNKLRFTLLTIICLFSILFYINSIKIENSENIDKNFDANDHFFENLYLLGTSYDEDFINSLENNQKIEISNFIEATSEEYEEIFYFICSTGSYFSLKVLVFFKNKSIRETSKKCHPLEIEGVKLTEEEMRIFGLIQEYLNNNRVFNKEKAALYIKSRYKVNGNLNLNGIKIVIDSLIKKKIILESSKLTRRTVLLNSNRKKLFDLINENPGIYKYKLASKLNVCPYVIKWHLSMLIKFQLVREQKLNNQIGYFEFSSSSETDDLFSTISREKCKRIINFLKKNKKSCTKYQICKELLMHYNTTTKYLNKLDKFNLLIRTKTKNIEYLTLDVHSLKKLKNMSYY